MSGNMEDKDRQKTKPRFTLAGSMRPTLLSLLLSSLVFSAPAQTELNRLDSILSSTYRPDRPGAAVAVIKGGRLIFKKGYGVSDLASKNSITTATNFNIGSMTKQFTAYGILMLRAKGSLSLSDPISTYFPRFVPHIADPMVFDLDSGRPPVASRGDFQIFRIAAVLNRIVNNVQNRLRDCSGVYRNAG
ncbi:MAG TPA: serine hydrolase domain-containing protein [Bacteroidota bacterium]|nr:serine hydrolase domain-containing protein [Bacteroidota bacterium]